MAESRSDHWYIYFSLHQAIEITTPKVIRRWAAKKLNADYLKTSYLALTWDKEASIENESAAASVDIFINDVTAACDSAMRSSKTPRKCRPVYWWTDEIAQLRKESSFQRRKYQRCQSRKEAHMVAEQYQQARKRLKAAIKASKKAAWADLKNLADDDLFGKPYKVIMKKLGGVYFMVPQTVRRANYMRHPSNLLPICVLVCEINSCVASREFYDAEFNKELRKYNIQACYSLSITWGR